MIVIIQHNNSVAFLIEEKGKKILVGKEIMDIEVKGKEELSGPLLQHILFKEKGTYAKISTSGIDYWQQGGWLNTIPIQLRGSLYMHYTQAPGKFVWALNTTSHEVLNINPLTGTYTHFDVSHSYRYLFNCGNTHVLAGDSMYAVYNDAFTTVTQTELLPFRINRVYIDRKGNKWFGSDDNGIYFIRKYAPVKIDLPRQKAMGLLNIEPAKDVLYLNTEMNGLLAIDEQNNCIPLFNAPAISRIMGYAAVGRRHLAGADGGLFSLDENFKNPVEVIRTAIKDVESGIDNEALVATANGAYIYRYLHKDSLTPIFTKRTTAICRANNTEIWLGETNGLHKVVQSGNTFTAVRLHLNEQIDRSRIVDIKRDGKGNMWVATAQNGLFFCPVKGNIVSLNEAATARRHLLSDICLDMYIANNGTLWVATVGGISVITTRYTQDEPTLSVSNYSVPEGMPGKTINSIAFRKNSIVVATPNGLFSFSRFPEPSTETGETVITQVKANAAIRDQANLVLPYDQNNLIISYASSFINLGVSYLFRYRVKELSNVWIETNALEVPLLGLKSGSYTFEIASVNSQGDAGKTATLHFVIRTPWFKQLWFILLVAVLLLFSAMYYYRLMKEKISMSRDLTLFRLRILRAQMNPHFVFNTLSNIQRLIQVKELKNAEEYIGTFATVMRKSIDYSGKEFIQLDKEIDYTRAYLDIEQLRFGEKFTCVLDVKITAEEQSVIYVPPLILQPLLENSIKHAFKGIAYRGEVNITIEKLDDNLLQYTIHDNGRGFDAAKLPARHSGLRIIKERVELLYRQQHKKGSFHMHSVTRQPGSGTTITICIPILKD
jgi:hypothetical protein